MVCKICYFDFIFYSNNSFARAPHDTQNACWIIQKRLTEHINTVWFLSHHLHAVDSLVKVGHFERLVGVVTRAVRLEAIATVAAELTVDTVK